jgi:hypothetical protein
VEDASKPSYEVIYYLAEIFQYIVHYIFSNFKIMSNTRIKTEIFDRNLHAAVRELLSVGSCTNSVDVILKNSNQVVETLTKGLGLQAVSTSELKIH